MQFISLGSLTLNVYPLLIAAAALGSLGVAWWQMRDARIFPTALILAIVALAFARAGYVALNWDYFREHGNEIVSLAGLSEHAAIAGAAFCYWLLARRVPLLPFSILNFQFLISAAASLGCIPNGCAFGREVFWQTDGANSVAWLLRADWPDAFGVVNPRWPTQALMAAWLLLTGVLVWAVTQWHGDASQVTRKFPLSPAPPLTRSPSHLLTFSFVVGDFLLQFLRGDPALMFANLRIYQWLDLGLIAICLVAAAARLRRKV